MHETLNPKRSEWRAKPQTLKGVQWVGAKPWTLKGVSVCENPSYPKKQRAGAKPQTLKEVGGCETPNLKRSGWVRNPEPLKGVGVLRNSRTLN